MSHGCKVLAVCCMDFRFQSAVREFLVAQGLENDYDLFSIAGTQKTFLDESTKAVALKQVELSQKLHGMSEVYLIAHFDCGAYGGNATLGGGEDELNRYRDDLLQAEQIIKDNFPEIVVHRFIAMMQDEKIEFQKQ